jgi:hypothetical protein
MNEIIAIAHQLHELAGIDRLGGIDTFFGRMGLFESELGREDTALLVLNGVDQDVTGILLNGNPFVKPLPFVLNRVGRRNGCRNSLIGTKAKELPIRLSST